MYQRYAPRSEMQPQKQGKPTAGEMKHERPMASQQFGKRPCYEKAGQKGQPSQMGQEKCEQKVPKGKRNPVLALLPSSVYNPETKKILGVLSAEDLLLIALIFLLLDSEETENSMLVYLLLYVLLSEHLDLPFSLG